MNRLLAAVLFALAGCGGLLDEADEFRNASPSRQGVEIKVPAKGGQALTSADVAQIEQALIGETAKWYTATRNVTVAVNGGTAWVLKLVETIISYPATTVDATHAVWGPWTEALSPVTYRFTVTKVATGYDYVLEGKAKTDADLAFKKIIFGHHEPGAAEKQGQGTFTVDWDEAQKLPEHGPEIGSAAFAYSRNAKLDVTVDVDFKQVKDDDHPGQRVDARYAFAQIAGGDGSFDFAVTNAQNERFSVKSRWHNDGAGRSDVKAFAADGTTLGTVNECWGATFLETYYLESWNPFSKQGDPASCVFADTQYSTL